ncbi:hypothetical protein EfmAA242_06290 [Enterococcus faecium]|nr:hypothetical protein EfmAA242_06290 [Enterococcus faecium]
MEDDEVEIIKKCFKKRKKVFPKVCRLKADELPLPHIDRVKFHRWSLFDVKGFLLEML